MTRLAEPLPFPIRVVKKVVAHMRKLYRKPRLRKHGKLSTLTQFHGSFHHHHDIL